MNCPQLKMKMSPLSLDFLAVELVAGHVTFVFNTGNGGRVLRDASPVVLNDDQWHEVRYRVTNLDGKNLLLTEVCDVLEADKVQGDPSGR